MSYLPRQALLNTAFPQNDWPPSLSFQAGQRLLVSFSVALEFLPPKCCPRLRHRGQPATVQVPEAPVDEDCNLLSGKGDVRSTS